VINLGNSTTPLPQNKSRSIATLKGVFTLSFMGLAAYSVFSRIYFPQAGLSESQFGLLLSIPGLVLFLSQPLWSVLSDYTGSARTNFQLMLSSSALSLLLLYFFRGFFLSHFFALILLMVVFSFFYTARGPVRNSLALSFLQEEEEGYGRIRLWSSVGFAAASVSTGFFLARTSLEYFLPIAAGFFLLSSIGVYLLEPPKRKTLQTPNVFKSEEIRTALKNRRLWVFLVLLSLLWMGFSGALAFLPMYLNRHFGFGLGLVGAYYAFLALAEVPFFHQGDKIMERIGLRPFLISGFALMSLTWLVLGAFTKPLVALAILLVRGVGFSFVYLGAVNYVDMEVLEETRTVGQSLFTVVSFGLAGFIGRSLFGVVAEYLSLPALYLIAGGLGFVATLGLLLFWSVPVFED